MTPDWGGGGRRVVAPHELSSAERAWIEARVGRGARIATVSEMPPSATAKHRIEVVAADGVVHRLVLRRFDDPERLAGDDAYLPTNEANALRAVEGSAVPAPRLYGADLGPDVFDVPALLESFISGAPRWTPKDGDLDGFLAGLAEAMVAVHDVAADPRSLPAYRPYFVMEGEEPVAPAGSSLWERAIERVATTPPPTRRCFIHRDLHAGNVMWDAGQVSGVVDWATACWGPPGIDLARMRLNLAGDLGWEAADAFTAAYAAAGGPAGDRHPYWDLVDAVDSLSDDWEPAEAAALTRFEAYVVRLVNELA